jgi:hypothetical protein
MEGVKKFVTWIMSNHPDARGEIKRVFADGDHVILHSHWHGLSDNPRGEDPVLDLRISELKPEDMEVLSPDVWFWLGSALTANDPELPTALIDALFQSTDDEVYRLKVADMSLRHPGLSLRYADARGTLRAQFTRQHPASPCPI